MRLQDRFKFSVITHTNFFDIIGMPQAHFETLFRTGKLEVTPEIQEIFDSALKRTLSDYPPLTNNLKNVVNEEVTFSCKEYFLVNWKIYKKYLEEHL